MTDNHEPVRIYLPCCPDFNGSLPCKGCGLTTHQLEKRAYSFGRAKGREEERVKIKQSVELWMTTHEKEDKSFTTDDFIKFITEEV